MKKEYSDAVKAIMARPLTGKGGGIPLTRGEVAMLFLDGYAGDGPELLDVRSQGYGDDDDWDGLTPDDVLSCGDDEPEQAYIAEDWEPLELWTKEFWAKAPVETAEDGPGVYEIRYREIGDHHCHVRGDSREDARQQWEYGNSVDYMGPDEMPEQHFLAVTGKVRD